MKKTMLLLTCALFGLTACGGGGGSAGGGTGGGGGGGAPGLPVLNNPAVSDLVAFAASEGTLTENGRGHDVRTASYVDGGVQKTARLVGSQDAGLLEVRTGSAARSDFDLIGGDSSRTVNHRAYYVGDAAGVVRLGSGQDLQTARGTAAVNLDTDTGNWTMGADLWMDQDNGLMIGIDGGVVDGNRLSFPRGQSAIVHAHPLNADGRGLTRLNETVRSDVVFSNDGKDAFGTIFGSNRDSGFLVDAGFAGTEYTGN